MSLIKVAYDNQGAGLSVREKWLGSGIGAGLGAAIGGLAGGSRGAILGAIPGLIYGGVAGMQPAVYRHSKIKNPNHPLLGMLNPMTSIETAADTPLKDALLLGDFAPGTAVMGGLRRMF